MRKTAVVLGASAGVGGAIADALAAHDYEVVGFHRGRQVKNVEGSKTLVRYHQLLLAQDVGSSAINIEEGLNKVSTIVNAGFGMGRDTRVSVLVHSLSGAAVGDVTRIQPAQIERTFNMLAHSFLYWVRGLRDRQLLAPGARFIALSNPCVEFYLRNSGVIGAAKAALEVYVKQLAVELGPAGYRVNAVKFGAVMTPAIKSVIGEAAAEKLANLHEDIVPVGRMQTANDVAAFVVDTMLGASAAWMNGAIIDFTGGAALTLMDRAFHGSRRMAIARDI